MMLKAVMRACLSFGERFFSVSQIVEATGMERQAVRHRLWKLETAGLITRFRSSEIPTERGRPVKETYYRTTSLLIKRFNEGTGRPVSKIIGWDRMWQAVRALRRFTRSDLAQICGQSMANVTYFTKAYRRAGYLRCLGNAGSRGVMWILAKDPGSKRPPYKGGTHVD
ncbi:MAG TPA: helix-turn-helix domain-containing protein [Syntrophorhabdaceae bacterium]|nr:helix-turn-helix domain-containing protein [Syntrophorhabdaceae bacterium]